ncbi:MAG: hemerythrin HHE cation binding domain-containing protein [bacterium]|nr:MAG: hemerythrin HHE cation binding domain-containing protein [bacterium]
MSIVNMHSMEILKNQHKVVIEMTTKILSLLTRDPFASEIDNISISLRILAGKVREHLALEDREIYPRLMLFGDNAIVSLITDYKNDIGKLLPRFNFYIETWLNKTKIQNSSIDFIKETNEILNALLQRIETEDKELYPLIEKLNAINT